MKSIRFAKFVSYFLLIIFVLQVTEVSCFSKDFPDMPVENDSQLKGDDSHSKEANDFSSNGIEHCQCPCHFSLLITPAITLLSAPCIASIFSFHNLSIQKISTNIFQPPKIIL